jgi:hypothetical protein
MRLLTQKNTNSDLIPQEPDGMVDEEDIPILDSWTKRVAEDLWVLGDETELSVPVDLEFAPWDEDGTTDRQDKEWEVIMGGRMDRAGLMLRLAGHSNYIRVGVNR